MPPSAFAEERDLSFQPVVNPAPRALTPEQVAFYNTHGYVAPFRAYTPAEAERNRAYFDDLLAKVQAARKDLDAYSINGYHVCCAGLHDIVTHPAILDHVQDIIGPDIVCWGSHFFCKVAHDPRKVAWHQDASYWPLTPARTVTVWLAIDDADRENAAMMFLPGTHTRGHLKWRQASGPAVLNQEIEDIAQFGEPVFDELKAGEFSLHADMLAHGSEPNHSDRRRCGLTIRYCPPSVRALDRRWARGGVLCRGSDPAGNWAHNPRPPGEDVNVIIQAIGAN
ncbi:MAG: phytanoyl-CoA dioxygenase family protein [Opitutaceae bacterium]|nr:phytanoyl-CoA dioxygenase family protein [Opitutaceae bacterium]